MKGTIKGSTIFHVANDEQGLMVIESQGSPGKIYFSPDQAKALADFIQLTQDDREKAYKPAYWSK